MLELFVGLRLELLSPRERIGRGLVDGLVPF